MHTLFSYIKLQCMKSALAVHFSIKNDFDMHYFSIIRFALLILTFFSFDRVQAFYKKLLSMAMLFKIEEHL